MVCWCDNEITSEIIENLVYNLMFFIIKICCWIISSEKFDEIKNKKTTDKQYQDASVT